VSLGNKWLGNKSEYKLLAYQLAALMLDCLLAPRLWAYSWGGS
jgi:hypothetical protein